MRVLEAQQCSGLDLSPHSKKVQVRPCWQARFFFFFCMFSLRTSASIDMQVRLFASKCERENVTVCQQWLTGCESDSEIHVGKAPTLTLFLCDEEKQCTKHSGSSLSLLADADRGVRWLKSISTHFNYSADTATLLPLNGIDSVTTRQKSLSGDLITSCS